jgi:hypothetical protein
MNKSMYFLIPAIIGVISLISYSTMNRPSESAHDDGHTTEEHATLEPAITVPHDDSGKAAHTD